MGYGLWATGYITLFIKYKELSTLRYQRRDHGPSEVEKDVRQTVVDSDRRKVEPDTILIFIYLFIHLLINIITR